MKKPTKKEQEIHRRTNVALWAYAYEVHNHSVVSDARFDERAREIDPKVKTGNKILDEFFKTEFSPDTGLWVHKHPELDKLAALYNRFFKA